MMPTPSPVAIVTAVDSSSEIKKRGNNNNNNKNKGKNGHVRVDDGDNCDGGGGKEGEKHVSTATVTLASPASQKITKKTNSGRTFLRNGSCLREEGSGSGSGEGSRRVSPNPRSIHRASTNSHPLKSVSTGEADDSSPRNQPLPFPPPQQQLPHSQQPRQQRQRQQQEQKQRRQPHKPPVASLSPGGSVTDLTAAARRPVVNFCPIQLSSPDSSIVSVAETTTNVLSPSDIPTTPPYPPPDHAEFPHPQAASSVVRVQALVHAEPGEIRPIPDEDVTLCKPQPECEKGNRDSGIVTSSLGTLPSPSRTESVLASSSSILDSPVVRPKDSSRRQASSSPLSTRRRNPSSLSCSSPPPPTSHSQTAAHSSSSSLPPLVPNSSSSPLPQIQQLSQRLSPTPSIESALAVSLASPKRRPLLNRPSTSLSAVSAASGKDLFESFEGANYSFDSLPGIEDLNSYDMPHSKKLVNAKEAFKPNVDSSPTCEVPGWHTSLAQRSLKYLDAPLSSAYEEPPLTFVSANGRGLWGQSGDWDLRTGSGQPVKGPEARSVAAAMAAMLYEEGYSDILPPQVGLNNQLEYPQSSDAPSLVSPTSPSESLHDENELQLRHLDMDQIEDVLHTSIVYTGAVLPTLHPDMQENLPMLPSARDLYENESSDEEFGDDEDGPSRRRHRRRLPSTDFKIFSGPSTPEEPPPSDGFKG